MLASLVSTLLPRPTLKIIVIFYSGQSEIGKGCLVRCENPLVGVQLSVLEFQFQEVVSLFFT